MAETRVVCIREIQKSLDQSVKRLIEDKINALGLSNQFRVLKTHIEGPHGSIIIFQGMQNHTADSIKSLEGFDIAWFEEAQSASEHSLGLLRPTIRKAGSELWFSWNPRFAKDPIDKLLRGEEKPAGAVVVQANYRQNPWFPEVLREEMEYDKRRDPDRYAHVWMGGYQKNSEATVFRNWRIDTVEIPADARPYYGGDWGFSIDPTVLVRSWFIDDRTLYIDKEAWKVGCEIDKTPALFAGDDERKPARWENPGKLPGVPGAAKWPITADSARPETIAYMVARGFNITPAKKGAGSLEEGVEFLKAHDIIVHPDCKHVIDELTLYSFKQDPKTNEVLPVLEDKHNHTIDAVRYAVENVRRRSSVFATTEQAITSPAINLPGRWARVSALVIDAKTCTGLWGAHDTLTDTAYLYDVYSAPRADLAVHANALKKRGKWIPALMEDAEEPGRKEEAIRIAYHLADLGVDLMTVPFEMAAGVELITARLATGRLKVFEHLEAWFAEYRGFGRDEKAELVVDNSPLMRCTALLITHGLDVAITEHQATSDAEGYDPAEYAQTNSTGY